MHKRHIKLNCRKYTTRCLALYLCTFMLSNAIDTAEGKNQLCMNTLTTLLSLRGHGCFFCGRCDRNKPGRMYGTLTPNKLKCDLKRALRYAQQGTWKLFHDIACNRKGDQKELSCARAVLQFSGSLD